MSYSFIQSKQIFLLPQTFHCGLKSYDFIFSFFDLITLIKQYKKDHVTFSDVTNLFSGILRRWKFLFLKCLFSVSFRRSICLFCNLNSEGNLTRKHLNLELFPEGGFQGFVLQIYSNSNCDISAHI